MKNIYLVQAGELFNEGKQKGAYIPYAVGAVAAYAWNDEVVKAEYSLRRFIFYRENILDAVSSMKEPFLVGFSSYVWNFAYNKALAQEVKKAYPDCLIIFGGHQIPSDTSLLEECGYIDFLMHGEGEIAFKNLLIQLHCGNDFTSVSNISYRNDSGKLIKNPTKRAETIDFPSPYLSGTFDPLFSNAGFKFIAIIETNRGCPYGCAFCDSIREKKNALQMIPTERVLKEIEWVAQHKIDYCLCIDSNFGICERDEQIVDFVIDINKKTGCPLIFNTAFAKDKDMTIYRIVTKLYAAGMLKESTLSFQSLSKDVLHKIGRKNMEIESFSKLMKLYNEAGVYPYTELILGLPGETYESFRDGFETLIEAGQQYYVEVFRCDVLVNSPMAKADYLKKYGVKTVSSPSNLHHYKPDAHQEPSGSSQIVVSTNAMDEEMWVKSNLFSAYIQSLFFMGALRFVSMYLFHEKQVKYTEFFENLINWSIVHKETVCGKIYGIFKNIFNEFLKGDTTLTYYSPVFGDVTWFAEEGVFLEIVYHIDDFFHEIESFVSSYDISKDILKDLLIYQKNMINVPGRDRVDFDLEYDFHNYFSEISHNNYEQLSKTKNSIHFTNTLNQDKWSDYARKIVWYGRKIGRTFYSQRNSDIMIEYALNM